MPKLSEIAEAVRETGKPVGMWSLLIYGPPKGGKTRLAATIAKVPYIKRVHFFDIENGAETLRTMYVKDKKLSREQAEKIIVYKIPDTAQLPMAMETMMKVLTVNADHIICEEHGKINCVACATEFNEKKQPTKFAGQTFNIRKCTDEDVVIIDSGSQLADSIMNYYMRGKESSKPTWDEYMPQGQDLTNALTIVQRARTNFIVTTHEIGIETKENDTEVERLYPLMGTKNFSRKCAKYFSHVAYLQPRLNKHRGGTSTTYRQDTITGSRGGWKLEDEDELDLSLLFAKLVAE